MPEPPRLPDEMLLRYTDVPEGRIRTRVLGRPQPDALPVVVVQGMAVSDYLLPACAALGSWTEVHLFDVPGFGGSGRPTRRLDVRGYGEAVVHWLEAAGLDRGMVVGHSSGTQVAAWAGVLAPDRVAAVGLASPTIDPIARPLPKLLYAGAWTPARHRPASRRITCRSGSAPASPGWRTWSGRIFLTGSRSRSPASGCPCWSSVPRTTG
jgi:pimeloyl-ACP methyl ester carboxylesterase